MEGQYGRGGLFCPKGADKWRRCRGEQEAEWMTNRRAHGGNGDHEEMKRRWHRRRVRC